MVLVQLFLLVWAIVLVARQIKLAALRQAKTIKTNKGSDTGDTGDTGDEGDGGDGDKNDEDEELGDDDSPFDDTTGPFYNPFTLTTVQVMPQQIYQMDTISQCGIPLNPNEEGIQQCIIKLEPAIIYPNNMQGVSVDVCLVQTTTDDDFFSGAGPTYQTVIVNMTFTDNRQTGGDLLCTFTQTVPSLTNPPTLTWNITTDLLLMSLNSASICTIATANATNQQYVKTNDPIFLFNNTLNTTGQVNSTTLYVPIAVINGQVPIITTNDTTPPNGVNIYDFNFIFGVTPNQGVTSANAIIGGYTFNNLTSVPNILSNIETKAPWYNDGTTNVSFSTPANNDQIAQMIFSIDTKTLYQPYTNPPYATISTPFFVGGSTYEFNTFLNQVLMTATFGGNTVALAKLAYDIQVDTITGKMAGNVIVQQVNSDPFSPYLLQYIPWNVSNGEILVVRADYANGKLLVSTWSNPNGDGSDAQVLYSMYIPVPNMFSIPGPSGVSYSADISLGSQSFVGTNGISVYDTNGQFP